MIDFIFVHQELIVVLCAAGVIAGILSGLFGVGGGAIIVPAVFFALGSLGYDQMAMHIALGTSLTVIIPTSIRSVLAHHKRGKVDWAVLVRWSPFIMFGAAVGIALASYISAWGLTVIFSVIALALSAQLFFGRPNWTLADDLPVGLKRVGLGSTIGTLSALMGIGGGTFGVTLMTICGRSPHQAVATAAGFGVAVGVPASVAAIITGLQFDTLPPGSLGFVNIPAVVLISVFSVAFAPIGVFLAHKLNAAVLRKMFGVFLSVVAVKMVLG
ncbi:sulfite exporter TauE/SafE family protein [Parasphingorhabdus sp.]|jgi:uncharacterized membrane protein YfcA|uniref:sulfite exporter TauE/SafE family protein n=1 Tax=Parasphingorhabdus sp. TaxID=2709688 RepID=UPI003D29E965